MVYRKMPRNTIATAMPMGYATAVLYTTLPAASVWFRKRPRHSLPSRKYVAETALMNVAGTAVIQ